MRAREERGRSVAFIKALQAQLAEASAENLAMRDQARARFAVASGY